MNIKRNPYIVCLDCQATVRRSGPAQKLCPDCRYRRKLAYSRRHLRAQRVTRGQAVRGTEMACGRCGTVMVKTGVNQKYCAPCSEAQKAADALEASRRYRAAKANAQGVASAEQIAARVLFYGALCYVCRAPYEAIDHVKPLAKGGSHWPANLRPICTGCNSGKRDRWPFAPAFRRRA
jgi:5-methylcytosine-specific restriction endonuclease McrA